MANLDNITSIDDLRKLAKKERLKCFDYVESGS